MKFGTGSHIGRNAADLLVAGIVLLLYAVFRCMPLRLASAAGRAIATAIGPRIGVSRTARKNLQYIFPDLSDRNREIILKDVWDNLGRMAVEYPHLNTMRLTPDRIKVEGFEHIEELHRNKKPTFLFSAHMANWEVIPYYLRAQGINSGIVYRAANNRYVDYLIQRARRRVGFQFIPKGKLGSRKMIEVLRGNGMITLLADQRMSDGEPIAFMDKPAMTGTGWLRLALRHQCAIVPMQVKRLDGPTFHLKIYPPLRTDHLPDDDNEAAKQLAETVNKLYADWIREMPGQWLWLHKRWGRLP